MISIVILEDDTRFLTILKKTIRRYGHTVDASFNNVNDFVRYINTTKKYPDICLLDLELPDKSGIDAVKEISNYLDIFNVLILTSFSDENKVFEALQAGASGYILKKELNLKLKDSIMDINNGGIVIEPILANRFLNYFKSFKTTQVPKISLSLEEKDILTFLVQGFTYKEIADIVSKTPRNIKYTLSKIYKKLNVKTKVEAVSEAVKKGLVNL